MNGQIIKVISNDYTVKLDNNEKIVCKPRGVFRNRNITPLAGDFVKVNYENKIIEDILPRKNELKRPPVSNIDIAIVVVSTVNPDFGINLLDKISIIINLLDNISIIIIIKNCRLTNKTTKYQNI